MKKHDHSNEHEWIARVKAAVRLMRQMRMDTYAIIVVAKVLLPWWSGQRIQTLVNETDS